MRSTSVKLVLAVLFCLTCQFASASSKKVALVVGISDYHFAPKLVNPINDAKTIAQALESIQFEVIQATDASGVDLESALTRFSAIAENAEIAIVYYAGHGIELSGKNYMIPADADVKNSDDLGKLVLADKFLKHAANAKKLSVVILDACRDNPFSRSLAESLGASRSTAVGRGISKIKDVPSNTLVAYATQAGNVALDGIGANSPYAMALSQHIVQPGKDIRMVFGSIRDTVLSLTNHRQEPFTYGSLGGNPIFLNAKSELISSSSSAEDEIVKVALNPNLTTKGIIVEEKLNNGKSITSEFVDWQLAKQNDQWSDIEQISAKAQYTIYGIVADELMNLRRKHQDISVNKAAMFLKSSPVLFDVLSDSQNKILQRKLAAASYYGGEIDGKIGKGTIRAFRDFSYHVSGTENLSFATILALGELSDSQNVSENLTGRWKGRYYYPRTSNGINSVEFEMDLVLSQGRITGFVSEPNTFGNKSSKNLYANFKGVIYGNEAKWVKQYDGTGGVSHSVNYKGIIDRKRRTIRGTWSIKGSWSGKFDIKLQ